MCRWMYAEKATRILISAFSCIAVATSVLSACHDADAGMEMSRLRYVL